MSAVESPPAPPADAAPAEPDATARAARRWPWWLGLAAVLVVALGLRLWGIGHGLPYAYNADENAHFVPGAIGLFGHGWHPHYFVNPPAYTYLLHGVFALWFGGREGVSEAYATHPTEVFVAARVTAAVVGTLGVWLLYCAGARLVDRRVGLLAAALLAVAFLPVFYSHLALNDVLDAGADRARPVGRGRRAAPRGRARLRAGRPRARPGRRDQVHGRHRAAAAARRGRCGAAHGRRRRRGSRAARPGRRRRRRARRLRDRQPATPCSTSPRFATASTTRPRRPATSSASSA